MYKKISFLILLIFALNIKICARELNIEKTNITGKSGFLGGTIERNKIESISFVNTLKIPSGIIGNYDGSKEKNKSIMVWYLDSNKNGLYEIYVGSTSGINAPNKSSTMFSKFSKLKKINISKLNTSNVEDIEKLFLELNSLEKIIIKKSNILSQSKFASSISNKYLVLSAGIDSSEVKNIKDKNGNTKKGLVKTGDKIGKNNVAVLGDINSDGKISSLDYIMIKNHIMGKTKITDKTLMLASDFSEDDKINTLDYIQIKKIILEARETEYEVSFSLNGGAGDTTSYVSVKYNQEMPSINKTIPKKTGYIFMGWYDNSDYTKGTQYYDKNGNSGKKYNIKKSLILYAGWKKEEITYTIKYYCDFANVSTSPFATQTVKYGSKVKIKDNTCANNTTKYPAKWRDPSGGVWESNKEYTWKYRQGEKGINEIDTIILTSVPNNRIYDSYSSSTLKYWIEKYGKETSRVINQNYIVTHIWVKDAYNQMKMTINPKKKSTQEKEYPRQLLVPRKIIENEIANSSLGLEKKGLVAINASPMIDEGGTWCSKCPKEWSGTPIISLKIHNGKIIRDSTADKTNVGATTSNRIYMLSQNGYLTYYKFYSGTSDYFSKNTTNRDAIINTVKPKYTFGFKPVLVWKGKKQLNDENCTSDFCKKANIRQSICQIDKNDFILITTLVDDVGKRSGGLTLPAIADIMLKYNCQTGFNLDGGGSTGYFYKKNNATLNGISGTYYFYRPNVEMLYFAEQ